MEKTNNPRAHKTLYIMKPIYIILVSLGMWIALPAWSQQESSAVRHGNKDYKKEKYTEAEINYRRGIEKNNESFEAHYNLGDALFKQDKYPEAGEEFAKAAQHLDKKTDKSRLASTYHNLGNCFFAQQQYDKAVAA